MEFRIWVETLLDGRIYEREMVSSAERCASGIGPEEIGLTLEEGKAVLQKVEARIVQTQADVLCAADRSCFHCGRHQRVKDRRPQGPNGVWKLSCFLPPLLALQMSGREAVDNLASQPTADVGNLAGASISLRQLGQQDAVSSRCSGVKLLPIRDRGVSYATLRRHTLAIGGRLDQRVTEPDEYDWPEARREPVTATAGINVSIDGTYVRADRLMGMGEYHVVAGRIERDGRVGGRFAWVAQHPMCDAEATIRAALEDNGWTPASRVRVLADGADGLSNLVNRATEQTPLRVLDWFHISMHLRPIEQMSTGIASIVGDTDPVLTELLSEKIRRVRFQMWNGQWQAALDRLGAIYRITKKFLAKLNGTDAERINRFRKHMLELRDYLCRNQIALRNYAQDRQRGFRISSALAESAMNHLFNQRMGKRQPMRWSAEGAHLLLQVRCAVLDNRLELLFREWLPNFRRPTLAPRLADRPQV